MYLIQQGVVSFVLCALPTLYYHRVWEERAAPCALSGPRVAWAGRQPLTSFNKGSGRPSSAHSQRSTTTGRGRRGGTHWRSGGL